MTVAPQGSTNIIHQKKPVKLPPPAPLSGKPTLGALDIHSVGIMRYVGMRRSFRNQSHTHTSRCDDVNTLRLHLKEHAPAARIMILNVIERHALITSRFLQARKEAISHFYYTLR